MLKVSVLLSLLGPFALAAQESATPLKGVLLLDDSSKVRQLNLEKIHGVQFDGIEKRDLEDELLPFLSSFPLTSGGAKELCEAIAAHYRETESLRVAVTVPDQDFSEGVVQLVVTPERLGSLNVKENRYTEPGALTKWVRLSSRDAINEKTLAQDVGWINTNPFRNVNIAYQPGQVPGITDIDLIVSDKKGWKVSTGVDNTGTNPIGPIRIFAGVNINDFIFTDHTLNLQATVADHFKESRTYTAQYIAPLPWRNVIRLYGTYIETAPLRATFPRNHRQTYQASGRYVIPQWFASNPFLDQISFEAGADFKGTNTNIYESDAKPPLERLAWIGQFAGTVNVLRNRDGNKVTLGADLIGSPASMLPHQTDEDFNNLRAGATPRYAYSRLSLVVDQKLPKNWKIFLQGRGQFAFSNLIPSEQFSIGGVNTVRGYEERAVNGDHAMCANLEIKTPEFRPVGVWVPKVKDSFYLLGFVDTGFAWLREAPPKTPLSQTLLGVGPGLRYSVPEYFTGRLDVGFPLLEVKKDSGKPRIHFNATLSY